MSFSEFKAWLEGFEVSFKNGGPSPEEWATIKAKLATVSMLTPTPCLGFPYSPPTIAPYIPPTLTTYG
jgi:hypothetical protein